MSGFPVDPKTGYMVPRPSDPLGDVGVNNGISSHKCQVLTFPYEPADGSKYTEIGVETSGNCVALYYRLRTLAAPYFRVKLNSSIVDRRARVSLGSSWPTSNFMTDEWAYWVIPPTASSAAPNANTTPWQGWSLTGFPTAPVFMLKGVPYVKLFFRSETFTNYGAGGFDVMVVTWDEKRRTSVEIG